MMKLALPLIHAALASQGLAARTCKPRLTPEKLEAVITTEGLERHLWSLDKLGRENGGNRAFGTPGYQASSDYLMEQIGAHDGEEDKEFRIWKQYFNHTFAETREISLTGPNGEDVEVFTLIYNHATPVPEGTTAQLVDLPVDDARGSGCFADQWADTEVTDKLVLVKRGVCAISDKIRLAKTHGALGVILFHNVDSTPNIGSLGASNIGSLVPVGMVRMSVGEAWRARLIAGEELTVTLLVDALFEDRETWNVFAETIEGDPDNVIVLGAHLDSVPAGIGMNDNGSGVVAQIEILKALRRFRGITNKVLFVWWGAEENGLIGSLYYTAGLTEEEADKIRFYYNYDMIGSPEPVYGIYVGENPGDMVGASLLHDYLVAHDRPAYYGGFGTGSDYLGFLNLGIPSSGIHTGGGGTVDPCYHLACDVYGNFNLDALTVNTKAAAVGAAVLALSVEGLPPRAQTSANPRGKNKIRAQFDMWRRIALEVEGGHRCATGDEHKV
ncbi:hypothetical protein B0I35DRAFT_437457 [Stachybotrys elegans]|uniref:Peptide hydrolase n=1 Tax=Stachybotrys elegans TaxID=80388 RepID=A0A8K0WPB5_9HYPO|nr:hypothetical protein B0I35DRAFT_437457 [Stachybotrys elegans]